MRENHEKFSDNVRRSLAGSAIRINVTDGTTGATRQETVSFPRLLE